MSACTVRRMELLQELRRRRERLEHFQAIHGSEHALVGWAKVQLELIQNDLLALLALGDCGE